MYYVMQACYLLTTLVSISLNPDLGYLNIGFKMLMLVFSFQDWIHAENAKKKITCNVCGSVTPLLLQTYAPVKERMQYHRTLYVFACINPNCWGNPKR